MWPAVKGGAVVIGSFMGWHGGVGVALRWACLLSMGNDNMKTKRKRGKGA